MGNILFMGLIAGLGTCLGAAFALALGSLKSSTFFLLLGLSAGAMLGVVLLDLLPAALTYGETTHCLSGVLAGIFFIGLADIFISHDTGRNMSYHHYLALGYLVVSAIAIHDLPEGLAIAAGYAEPIFLGPLLTLAIGLHNILEGMATAAPLRAGGISPGRILIINFLLSLVTPIGSALGILLITFSPRLISFLLAFAAGTMSYIVFLKLFPESKLDHQPLARAGLFLGLAAVSLLNLFF
jgi:ZIP family zinc transporter